MADHSLGSRTSPRMRKAKSAAKQNTSKNGLSFAPKKQTDKAGVSVAHTIQSVLDTWSDATDYGVSFRAMTPEERVEEIKTLNKGATKGMKDIIRKKVLGNNYKVMVAQKLRDHIIQTRAVPAEMFHCAPKSLTSVTANIKFLSVGEWVEVDADRTPGYNSEGGIAVIINVHDDLTDVKYVCSNPTTYFAQT